MIRASVNDSAIAGGYFAAFIACRIGLVQGELQLENCAPESNKELELRVENCRNDNRPGKWLTGTMVIRVNNGPAQ